MRSLLKTSGKSSFFLRNQAPSSSLGREQECWEALLATRGAKLSKTPILKEKQRPGRNTSCSIYQPWRLSCLQSSLDMCWLFKPICCCFLLLRATNITTPAALFHLPGLPFHSYFAGTSSDFFRIRERIGHRIKYIKDSSHIWFKCFLEKLHHSLSSFAFASSKLYPLSRCSPRRSHRKG